MLQGGPATTLVCERRRLGPAPGRTQMPEGAALATRLADSRAVEAMIWGMPAKPLFDKTWKLPDAERLAGW